MFGCVYCLRLHIITPQRAHRELTSLNRVLLQHKHLLTLLPTLISHSSTNLSTLWGAFSLSLSPFSLRAYCL